MSTKKTKALTAEDLIGEDVRETRKFEIKRLGGVVYLKEMTASEVLAFEGKSRDEGLEAVVRSVVNEDGEPLFDKKQIQEVKKALGWRTYKELQDEVLALNDMSPGDVTLQPAAVREALKTAGIADDRATTVMRLLGAEEGNR